MTNADPDTRQATENARNTGPEADKAKEKGTPEHLMPAAGPHADPDLTDTEKTPGAGSLPDPDDPQEGDATTG